MSSLQKYLDYKNILSVTIFIRCEGKILLLKRADTKTVDPGMYTGVGGKVEPKESIWQAVFRETKQETGIDLNPNQTYLSGIVQVPDPSVGAEWISILFNSDIAKQIAVPTTEDGEFFWIDPKEISKLPILPDVVDYLNAMSQNPKAKTLSFCDYDKNGELLKKETQVFNH